MRRAFTLIELLIAISIVAILAAITLGVIGAAGQTARAARTKQLISRLHSMVMEYNDELRDRRVEVNTTGLRAPGPNESATMPLIERRLNGKREAILLEMPDRWSDILNSQPVDTLRPNASDIAFTMLAGDVRSRIRTPGLWDTYIRHYRRMRPVASDVIEANQGAECLYMIVMYGCADGEAKSQFNPSDIGDVDNDGAPEFLDGWKRPIEFLRWAPGFYSPAQLSPRRLGNLRSDAERRDRSLTLDQLNQVVVEAIAKDADPADLFRRDIYTAANASAAAPVRGYRLMPLIVSSGSDEEFGIEFGRPGQTRAQAPVINRVTNSGSWMYQWPDPYLNLTSAPYNAGQNRRVEPHYLGSALFDTAGNDLPSAADNYTNHFIEYEKRR